jgi:hypothetical protein
MKYETPQLTVMGDIRTLTQATAPGFGDGPTGDAGIARS